ncbi:hypothetical protein F6B41_18020 [Microbacterium lushaniae]|nr:hypothetical protein F6B41_20505 [Microbacterium lushaniae]KAA9152354.1 hypothetical protein F6B41_18020 [Microbacterium lushaniae]
MIPAFEDDAWYLPPGQHAATLDEIEERFVDAAPFTDERRIIFDAFRLWHGIITTVVPSARFWVDGGFVTHKPWAAPSDVDVTVMLRPDDLNNLTPQEQQRLDPMFTKHGPPRQQPMSGLVDAFVCLRGDVDKTLYWREHWSTVLDESRVKIEGTRKGFVEVKP